LQAETRGELKGQASLQIPLIDVRNALGLSEVQSHSVLQGLNASGWSIDSRTVNPGDLFFAIKGEIHDGHAFVGQAFERGAIAAVVSDTIKTSGPILQVPDTLAALQQLGQWARRRWAKPIVAVTGSAGKTTTKDIIAELLGTRMSVGKTVGNLNNHFGLPLSLLRMPDSADVGVLELGMNHTGEIRFLASLAEPQIAVVTNVGYAHIESFASIEGIALAKRELVEALPATGTAVLNADDPRVLRFRDIHPGRTITYGLSPDADIRGEDIATHDEGASFSVQGTTFHTTLAGRHGISNILAGIAVASSFGIQPAGLVTAVSQLAPGKMRGQRRLWRGITILDDSYNSNPDAAKSMIDVLRDEPAVRRIAVLGEMLELGNWAEQLHQDVGTHAAAAGIDVVIGIHGAARSLSDAARDQQPHGTQAYFFDRSEEAGEFLRHFAKPGDAILFKGSRGTRVERALAVMES
jgi:UDP-N-acetylmuramoyl-tripeptide--D-alanyl-D-alanine ligase